MKRIFDTTGELIDPHTAIGVAASSLLHEGSGPIVAQAVAHPAKYPEVVEQATGVRPKLPFQLADLYNRQERFDVCPNSLDKIKSYVLERI